MISAADKSQLQLAMAKAFDDFIRTLSSFDETDINQVPFTGSWTPAQVAVHIILATDGVPDAVHQKTSRPYAEMLSRIRPWWEDLNQKFTSPEPLQPDNTVQTKESLLSELRRVRRKDLDILQQQDLTAICMDFELPTIGYLTRFEWLWFIEMHLRRHLHQLVKMKNALGNTKG